MFKIRENDFASCYINAFAKIMIVSACGMCSLILPDSAVYDLSRAYTVHTDSWQIG